MEGYHGYLLFAWMYGAFVGGLNFSLATFVLERSRIRHFARDWGFIQGSQSVSQSVILCGVGCWDFPVSSQTHSCWPPLSLRGEISHFLSHRVLVSGITTHKLSVLS